MTTPTAPSPSHPARNSGNGARANDARAKGARAKPRPAGPKAREILVGGVLIALFLYELLFNVTPTGLRLQLAAGIAGAIVMLSIAWILASPRIWRVILFALLLVIAGCWLIGEANGEGTFNLTRGIRFLMPLFFALWIIELRQAISPRLVFMLASLTLVVATLSSVLRPQEVISNLLRLAPFTGGESGAHASAYVISLCALLIHQLWLNRSISKRLAWSILTLAGLLLIGLRVATPIFMLLNYGLLHILLTRNLKSGTKILLWIVMTLSILSVLFWQEALQEQSRGGEAATVENLGSGRVGTWLGRIEILSRRSVPALLFGTGPGSDSFYSDIWWWEKKDAHQDILTTIIESGFVGLLALLLFLFLLFRRLGREGIPLVWYLFAGSMVSNALLQRPIIATLFWLAVALAALRVEEKLRAGWRDQQIRRRFNPRNRQPQVPNGPPWQQRPGVWNGRP